jgi:hypothetical protein
MSIRDNALPKFDKARTKIAALGLRRFQVILRRRVWSGSRVGEGTPTNQDMVLTPTPRVRFMSPFAKQMEYIVTSGGKIQDRYYKIDKITPAFTSGVITGGYSSRELNMAVGPDLKNVEPVVILIGDDGMARACEQILLEDDRSFGYSMTVQQRDGDSVAIASLAITAPTPLQATKKQQLAVVATFEDNSSFDITPLVLWTTADPTKATINLLGVATGVAAGTVQVGASMGRLAAPAATLTVTP